MAHLELSDFTEEAVIRNEIAAFPMLGAAHGNTHPCPPEPSHSSAHKRNEAIVSCYGSRCRGHYDFPREVPGRLALESGHVWTALTETCRSSALHSLRGQSTKRKGRHPGVFYAGLFQRRGCVEVAEIDVSAVSKRPAL